MAGPKAELNTVEFKAQTDCAAALGELVTSAKKRAAQ